MPISTKDTIGILADNLERRRSVLPIPTTAVTHWTEGLNLPRGGPTVLYTGQMYQLIPYIEALVAEEKKLGDSWMASLSGIGRALNRGINLAGFMGHPKAEDRARYEQIPRNVARLLNQANVPFGSLYEDDWYSGALLYDLGEDEVVADHARKVYAMFQRYKVERVITIDPHTTNMLRSVYPRWIPNYSLKVQSYLEVLAERGFVGDRALSATVAIHDSCVYARYEGVIEEPRSLLKGLGLEVKEPPHARTQTWCCGGPAESLFPDKAEATAKRRVEELAQVASLGVTMCPICWVNLEKATDGRIHFQDISEWLCSSLMDVPLTLE